MHVMAVVHLHNTHTGQRLVYHDKAAYASQDAALQHWLEGECGCDCNRSLAIWKASGQTAMPKGTIYPCRRGAKQLIVIEQVELLVVVDAPAVVAG